MFQRNTFSSLLGSTAIILISCLGTTPALAQDNIQLDQIVVTTNLDAISDATTKTDDAIIDTLAGTSIVTETELKQFQPGRPSEVLAAVPGVEVQEDSDDPASAINIRGLQDFGRVNVMIDGARQNFQRSGHSADGQFYLEPELIKQVDIVRGPVSTIYGSGAIGGIVNFETIDPFDFLRGDETWATSIKGQYNSNDEGYLVSTIGATKLSQNISVLANFVYRDNDNYEDGNGNEIPFSGEEIITGLGKAVIDFAPGNQLKLSYLHQRNEFSTFSSSAFGNTTRESEVEDRTATLKWLFNPTNNDLIDLSASTYYTSTSLDQERLDTTSSFFGNQRSFKIDTFGFDIFNTSRFSSGQLRHTVTYGGDYFKDEVETEDPLNSGDEFTPSGERIAYGFFIQDKLEYSDWFELIGALRYDAYDMESAEDDSKSSGDRLSPKFTVGVKPTEFMQLFASYSEGYRAPAITETFNLGTHPNFGPDTQFSFLPNPDLEPETARNVEGGVNLSFDNVLSENDKFRAKATYFHNEVDNFIEGQFFFSPPCTNGDGCFQYQNISEAFLRGFELEANYDARSWFASLSYTNIRGDDVTNNEPLQSIFPEKVVATLGFRLLDEKLVVGGRWTGVAAQDRVAPGVDPSESYDLFDLFATYEVNENFSTALTLKNITDEQFTRYLNLETNPEPGFSARISGTIRFGG